MRGREKFGSPDLKVSYSSQLWCLPFTLGPHDLKEDIAHLVASRHTPDERRVPSNLIVVGGGLKGCGDLALSWHGEGGPITPTGENKRDGYEGTEPRSW